MLDDTARAAQPGFYFMQVEKLSGRVNGVTAKRRNVPDPVPVEAR